MDGKDLHPEVMTCINLAVAGDHFFVGHDLHMGTKGKDITRYQFLEDKGNFIGMGVLALNERPQAIQFDHAFENLYITTLDKNLYKFSEKTGKHEKILKTDRYLQDICIAKDNSIAVIAAGYSNKDKVGGAVYVVDLNKKKIIAELR